MAKIKTKKASKMTDLEKKIAELQEQQKKVEAEYHQSIGNVVCNNWDVEINPEKLEQIIIDLSHIANKMLEESLNESSESNEIQENNEPTDLVNKEPALS
ncbi:hypothetical protein [Bacillus pseudomycoides]|uniref:hypothetical protein n=1 Tax=Bacillus pseudomycoides TaxID=64104 RepID=UPI000BF041D7|nr:hypothetical protein [Bacillus pseudomycoides]PEM69347.1 hypothetical protein CN619_21680 [Bacillus pseudomycoides]PGA62181.1 hypothetical protein COL84_13475 [Bacillus pseudomycoides]